MTLAHVGIHVNDFAKAKEFYSKTLAPLGYTMAMEMAEWQVAGFGRGGRNELWISADGSKQPTHVAFEAESKATVDAFYKEGLATGGKDNGAPGYRKEYSPGYYAAFLYDPDGHNIEAVYRDPNPSE